MVTEYVLGKIDFNHIGRKINKVVVVFDDGADHRVPDETYGMPTYEIWNGRETDMVQFGPLNAWEGENSPLDKFPEIANMPIYKLGCYFADKYGLALLKTYTRPDRELFNVLCAGHLVIDKM